VLRGLYLKENNTDKWKKLMSYETLDSKREGTKQYKEDLKFLSKYVNIVFSCTQFSDEEIMKIKGIIQVN